MDSPIYDGGYPIVSYFVRSSPQDYLVVVRAPITTITVTGLTNGTSYTFTVAAVNEADAVSDQSDPSNAVTPLNPTILCFNKGSKILVRNQMTQKEEYIPVERLRKGDLVKTLNHGVVPIHMIGCQEIYNASDDSHNEQMLHKCSPEQYPELLEDLIITGHHSILVDKFKEGERDKTEKILGRIYLTDTKARLPACVDKRATPYKKEGIFSVYHFSLENDNDQMNYGVYANGLLVETVSKRYLRDVSGMRFV